MKSICIGILLVIVSIPLQGLSNEYFGKGVMQFIESKISESKHSDTQWNKEVLWNFFSTTGYLIFTATDMNRNGMHPDTSFNNVYPEKNFNIQAWKMPQLSNQQQGINILFKIPDDYDYTQGLKIILYILVQGSSSTNNAGNGNIEILVDSKRHGDELGPDFAFGMSTGNFFISEPDDANNVSIIVVEVDMPQLMIKPRSLSTLLINRVPPIDNAQEYNGNIYLEGVIIAYEKK